MLSDENYNALLKFRSGPVSGNFLDEIKILYKLNHKNIVRIYNYYAYENIFTGYILMEYIDGKNIEDFINDYFAPLEEITLDDIFLQLIDAFCYIEAHGVIHRDIREGNILIDKMGTVKVIPRAHYSIICGRPARAAPVRSHSENIKWIFFCLNANWCWNMMGIITTAVWQPERGRNGKTALCGRRGIRCFASVTAGNWLGRL